MEIQLPHNGRVLPAGRSEYLVIVQFSPLCISSPLFVSTLESSLVYIFTAVLQFNMENNETLTV